VGTKRKALKAAFPYTIPIFAGFWFLPFLIFREGKPTPKYIQYLGSALPSAIFGMLVVYCLKDVNILSGSHGLPEAIGILATVGLHFWQHKMLLSIAGGTAVYMLLLHFVF